ncbi:MAG: hypothetical protein IJ011_10705, partial [Clostridia bacterium]|nr:hypothetical protein [Clostridia bacterium]
SSFSLIKNRWVRSNVANPLLRGQFCETDGETRITIRATYRVMDMVGHMITAVIFLAMAIYIFIISASDSLIMACGCSGVILIIGAVWALVSYLLFVLNVRSSVSWLKRALGVR